jgi:hypothetical protein
VIDLAANKLLGSIHLREDVPAALSPLYRAELLVQVSAFRRTTRRSMLFR